MNINEPYGYPEKPADKIRRYACKCLSCKASFSTDRTVRFIGWTLVRNGTGDFYHRPEWYPVGHFPACPSCGCDSVDGKPIKGTYFPAHKCDARCTNARGHICECECGGVNHGKGRLIEAPALVPA